MCDSGKKLRCFVLMFVPMLLSILAACTMTDLPRNMRLKAFDPFRESFECKHEADVVPAIDPEAQAWFDEAMRLTSYDLRPHKRDYAGAVRLWQQAADRKHWKAMLNLANAYMYGRGVDRDSERAVQLVESAMKLGIPAAFDRMGTYHQKGLGVNADPDRAYAFWQLAADMGSPDAQAYLGERLDARYSSPKESFWANKGIAVKMLECGFAQENGAAASSLGLSLELTGPLKGDKTRALHVFHDGVKYGNSDCAAHLSVAFSGGSAMVGGVDKSRHARYELLADALLRNPDLRLPNLDKILPLPPASLPKWDGDQDTLVNAAKAVSVVAPVVKPPASAASQRTGRAHIPNGYALPEVAPGDVFPRPETTSATEAGYWLMQILVPRTAAHVEWNAAQVPLRYAKGELFDRSRPGLVDSDGRIHFVYLGVPAPVFVPPPVKDPKVARGLARPIDPPPREVYCAGDLPCRATGVWQARVPDDHPQALGFNTWDRQAYVAEGERFPKNELGVPRLDVTWQWLGQANEERLGGTTHITS